MKLLQAALRTFAAKGLNAPLIDDFIAAAEISRGTFYNYFDSTSELLDAVTAEVSDRVLANIEGVVKEIDDPVRRVETGCLLYMRIAVDHPAWGGFIVQTAGHSQASGQLINVYLTRDLALAQKSGAIGFPTVIAARDLIIGSIHQAIKSVLSADAAPAHLVDVLKMALRALNLDAHEVAKIGLMDLPSVELPACISTIESAWQSSQGKSS